jgi:ADP-ribosylglycohydrolase/tetratricopeptide (TPR) repeat protein
LSIFEETNQRRLWPHPSLRLFANRYEATREFAARLNDDPPPLKIVFYTAMGGNGKTALLRHFQFRCCYRLPRDQWQEILSYEDEFFADALGKAPGAVTVPVAFLDFGARPQGVNRPQEALSGLFMIKRQLARFGVRTPRFDFAAITYLHKSGADVGDLIRELFPSDERSLAADVADTLINLPVIRTGIALYEIVNRRLDDLFTRRKLQRRVPTETADEVLALPAEPDLADELPRLFAEDLKEAFNQQERIVLMLDTYEAFTGETSAAGRLRTADLGGPRWVRSLLGHAPIRDGVVIVVAGRTPPGWADAPTDRVPDEFLDTRALGPLSTDFANLYLIDAGVSDPAVRAALIQYAEVEPGQTHPLLLGLATDVVFAAQERGVALDPLQLPETQEFRQKERELVARLLQNVTPELEDAIVAVSAPRSFDEELFRMLGEARGFPAGPHEFARTVGFSFVTQASGPRGSTEERSTHEVHRLLRRALARAVPDELRRVHEVLAGYYAAMATEGEFTARMEEIYHRGQLNAAEGMALWRETMERNLAIGRYDRCRSLVTLLSDLEPPTAADRESSTYLVARAELELGRPAQAEQLLAALEAESPYATLLRSDIAFVRGDLALAEQLSDEALREAGEVRERLPFLFRSAELRLFLGKFDVGRRLCEEGREIAREYGDLNETSRWLNLFGEIEFFAGRVDSAQELFRQAEATLQGLPADDRNRALEAGLLQSRALVAEALGRPAEVRQAQEVALGIRREIGDARGTAHSLHGMGRAAAELGDLAEAERLYAEAATAARDLGEELLFAKVMRARGEAAIAAQRFDDAERLIDEAEADFDRCGTPYDVAHARLTRYLLRRARDDYPAWIAELDAVRQSIEREGHHSLYVRYPSASIPGVDRFVDGMIAYAAGDALGVPWEGRPSAEIPPDQIFELPQRDNWPQGATSDDTAQLLLVARLLADTDGRPTAEGLLALLNNALPDMRGVGPTTSAAIEHFRRTGGRPGIDDLPEQGATNGAVMRVLPAGWIVPVSAPELRREIVQTLCEATHPAPQAVGAAQVVAAMAAHAIDAAPLEAIQQAALDELELLPEADFGKVSAAAEGSWAPGPSGVSLDAIETVAAVFHVIRSTPDLASALPFAVGLGGDTDTVAAIVGGILGCRGTGEVAALPWLDRVVFGDREAVRGLSERLREIRRSWYAR